MNELWRRHCSQKENDASDIARAFGHFAKSALGMALRFASVSMMLGRIEFARTPVPFRSAASESIMATAAALDAAYCPAKIFRSSIAAIEATLTIVAAPLLQHRGNNGSRQHITPRKS